MSSSRKPGARNDCFNPGSACRKKQYSRRESARCQRESERMDKLKVPLSVSVREVIWMGLKQVAERERKKVSEITELTLEWSVAQLRTAGSINRLLKCKI